MVTERSITLLLVIFLGGIIFGYLLFDWQNKDSVLVKTVTEVTTDTLFVHTRDTITITKTEIEQTYLRDTIFLEPYEAKINTFKTTKDFLYGSTTVEGEVLGEVLKMDIINDFKIPTVTNTINTTNMVIKKPSGLFLTVGVTQQLNPSVGVTLVKDKYLFGLTNNSIQLGYKLGSR
jgi:hypothetical protein